MSLRSGLSTKGLPLRTEVSTPQNPRQYTAGTSTLPINKQNPQTVLTRFRFVHLENAYEFAEEYDKPLCIYMLPL